MGSERGQVPTPSTGSATLEAKIDSLAYKLELLLGTGHGGCPVCLTCSVHLHQHEATQRQLAAQSRLLDKLERKIGEIQKSLDGVVKGTGAGQRDRERVVTGPKPTGGGTKVDQPQPQPVSHTHSEALDPKQATVHTKSKRQEGTAKGAHVISGNPEKVKGQPMQAKLEVFERAEAAAAVQSAAVDPKSQSVIGRKAAEPQKPCRLAVPMVTMESPSLRHVSSCPESLQRLQGSDPGCAAVRGSTLGPGPECGIQIRVVSATSDTTRSTSLPQICHKVIDDVPPQPAPFLHRSVSLCYSSASDTFIIHQDVLGGGRFGKVHGCTERSSGLRLAAKIINTRNGKEKEMALNEVQVMNQLSHANILQLYDAFETRTQVMLILEYVEGGELFDRIVDESAPLTEVDAMVFVKQICEGLHYMHQMYVLHLDLKPENILCVNHTSHQVKIIDFGLARRYRPREKLQVNFGTPEFLAPEVVNFDSVSFPTDMWTLGVVTYMLVSGMSPFLGDDDSQTLNNVLAVNWYFDEEAFEHVSAEARDFIANLLIRERGGRLSAAQCLRHPWLNNISEKAKHNNIVLKSQVLLKKYMAKRLWKKNYIAITAANRLKKIGSSGSLTSLGV
uniref:myosin light chain kinase 2, skeletal/cardiac muscle n=1 Tax=Centroberyx gerrardi TaxID=166262 RepID=UPI003AAFDCC8